MNKNNMIATITAGDLLCVLLTIAFVVLKLCNVINWSWLWILAPLWIPMGIGTVIVLIFFLIIFFTARR